MYAKVMDTKKKLRGFSQKLYRPKDRSLSAKLMSTFADREGCRVVSKADPLWP
jgi:hypothetical protein